jgi:hypothetical protein
MQLQAEPGLTETPIHQDAVLKVFRDRVETATGTYLVRSIDGVEWTEAPVDAAAAVDDLRQAFGAAGFSGFLTGTIAGFAGGLVGALVLEGISRAFGKKHGLYLLVGGVRVRIAEGGPPAVADMGRALLAAIGHARSGGVPS